MARAHKLLRVQLTKGEFALIDEEDYELVNQYSWHCSRLGYACAREKGRRSEPRKQVWMHRLIANTPDGMITDHINGNKLDNRKSNLRACDKQGNAANTGLRKDNTSGFKGVSWSVAANKWVAWIQVNGKQKYLGCFSDIKKAATAYQRAAKTNFGEYYRG